MSFFCGDRDLFPFAINVNDSNRPEGNQIDSGHEFGKECWQKFPVPPEQVHQQGGDCKIKHVISGRQSAFRKQWKHNNLKSIGRHGQNHGGSKTCAWRERGSLFSYRSVCFHIVASNVSWLRIPIGVWRPASARKALTTDDLLRSSERARMPRYYDPVRMHMVMQHCQSPYCAILLGWLRKK